MVLKIINLITFPFFTIYLIGDLTLPPSFSNLSNLAYLSLLRINFQGFKKNFIVNILIIFFCL